MKALLVASALLAGTTGARAGAMEPRSGGPPAVHVVLFTHVEDNAPPGVIGSPANQAAYASLRARLLEMGALAAAYGIPWSLQPDWKLLLAAQQYEGAANFLVTLRDDFGVAIDPHSHEGGGYNYTDVAYLLETLGVGGSTVIGGHVWDPGFPQFQEWDRYRVPVPGLRYPAALWRGDILMGSGTPNHVDDPIVSGVWRPRDRYDYWTDDPAANIAAVGAFTGTLSGVDDLVGRYRSGEIPPECLLTASLHVRPADITAPGGLAPIETGILKPLAARRQEGAVVLSDFTALVDTWRSAFQGRACLYRVITAR